MVAGFEMVGVEKEEVDGPGRLLLVRCPPGVPGQPDVVLSRDNAVDERCHEQEKGGGGGAGQEAHKGYWSI